MQFTTYITLGALALLGMSCEQSIDDFAPHSGKAIFNSYVAVGDNYTAGYTNGALGREGQLASYPNILATQLSSVGGGIFTQPLAAEGLSVGTTKLPSGYLNGYYALKVINGNLKPVPGNGNIEVLTTPIGSQAPFHNVGVPGAKSFHLLTPLFGNPTLGSGNYNPFYTRFASKPGTSTLLGDALLSSPTFFTLWIGMNDVLTYAMAGGQADAITPPAAFEGYVTMVLDALTTQTPQGAIANIPALEVLPYFGYITSAGYQPFLVEDATTAAGYRAITANEKILLPASDSITMAQWGQLVSKPIKKQFVLDETELSAINAAIDAYNTSLEKLAQAKGLAYVDMHALMAQIAAGKWVDGNKYTAAFISGGFFSLDGIHPTPRASAIIANTFISAINAQYGANVPMANVNDYSGVVFP